MKKVQIDPATQRRPTSRKQNRSARIKEQLTQQMEVQVIPAKADMEGYERPNLRTGTGATAAASEQEVGRTTHTRVPVHWYHRVR